jgi:hypothetical protein
MVPSQTHTEKVRLVQQKPMAKRSNSVVSLAGVVVQLFGLSPGGE